MTYFSGLHHKPSRHADLKRIQRIHRDSQETKPFRVENDTKTVNSGFLSPVSMSLVFVFTQLFYQIFFPEL